MDREKNKIYYLGFYGDEECFEQSRSISRSGVNKMNYVINAIIQSGKQVEIISPVWSVKRKDKLYYSGRKFTIESGAQCNIPPTVCCINKFERFSMYIFVHLWLIWFFIRNIRKRDCIVVYHSLFYIDLLILLKKLFGFKLVLELEEIYSLFNKGDNCLKKEMKIIQHVDNYIFVNDIAAEMLDVDNSKWIACYGDYTTNYKQQILASFEQDRIHIVYAGSIDVHRNSAFVMLEVAKKLPANYVLHIIGFGYEHIVQQLISDISALKSECTVRYEGSKKGEEYNIFMSNCMIGVNPQVESESYMDYAFPSKTISYLSHGLRVVTTELNCFTSSKVNDLLDYCDPYDIDSIVKTIVGIDDFDRQKPLTRIKELDQQFVEGLKNILR